MANYANPPVKDGMISVEDFEKFKNDVISVALEYAEEHNLCETVEEALEQMGLQKEWKIVPVKFLGKNFTFKVDPSAYPSKNQKEWLQEQLSINFQYPYLEIEVNDASGSGAYRTVRMEDGGTYSHTRVDEDLETILWDSVQIGELEEAQSESDQFVWGLVYGSTSRVMHARSWDGATRSMCNRITANRWWNEAVSTTRGNVRKCRSCERAIG